MMSTGRAAGTRVIVGQLRGSMGWWFWRRRHRQGEHSPGRGTVLLAAGAEGVIIAAVILTVALLPNNTSNAGMRPGQVQRPVAGAQVQQPAARTVVSLTFDNAYENQWRYAVPLLRSYHMNATFYAITSDIDWSYQCCMSWAQLRTLQKEGNDIGSHTVSHPNLTTVSPAEIRQQVCGSRQDMVQNGITDPVSFAYPFGTYDPTAERIVAQCGFTNARQGGGVAPSNTTPGPPWAESLPPRDPEAVRTIAVDGWKPMRLTDLEKFVTSAAVHGGSWLVITFHDVCDANEPAPDLHYCMSTYGPIKDTVLGQFLGWLHNSGQPGGAPAGVVVRTMRSAMNTANR